MALEDVPPILSQRGIICISTISGFWFLALIFLCLRLFTNLRIRRFIDASDWLLAAGFLGVCGFEIIAILVSLYGGLGFNAATIDHGYETNNLKLDLGGQTAHAVSLGLIKCAICHNLASVIPSPAFRVAITVVAVCCVCWSVAGVLVDILACQPMSLMWNHNQHGTCGDFVSVWTAIGAIDVITDAAIFIVPLPLLHRFKMNTSRKLAVSSIFLVGAATTFLAIIRTATSAHIDLIDVTYGSFWYYIWSGVEAPLAVIVGSMMSLRPLCMVVWPPVCDFLGLPVLDSEEEEEEDGYYVTAYTPEPEPHRQYRQSYDSHHTEHTNPFQRHTPYTETQRSSTFLDMNDDNDDATFVPSMAELSHPPTSARSKGKKRNVSHEEHELSRNSSRSGNGIFSMGATAPLEPEGSEMQMQQGPSGIFSMGATPALEPEAEEKSRKKRGWWKG